MKSLSKNDHDIDILHRDDALVVASKPGGMLVHRSPRSSDQVFFLQELGRLVGCHLYPVHRLDRAASGAIAMAFSSEVAKKLQANLSADDAVKEYIALVRGETPEQGESQRPLTDHNTGVKKSAHTLFERIAVFSRCSLLRVRIRTGRHHQIRRHMSHLCHQMIGDTSHGKGKINTFFRENYGLPRLFLHAAVLDLRHPTAEGRLRVRSPLPKDLREFLLRLPDIDEELVAGL